MKNLKVVIGLTREEKDVSKSHTVASLSIYSIIIRNTSIIHIINYTMPSTSLRVEASLYMIMVIISISSILLYISICQRESLERIWSRQQSVRDSNQSCNQACNSAHCILLRSILDCNLLQIQIDHSSFVCVEQYLSY